MNVEDKVEFLESVGSVGWNWTNTSPRTQVSPTPYWAVSSKDRERLLGIQDLFDGKGTIRQHSKSSFQWRVSGTNFHAIVAELVDHLETRLEFAQEVCGRYGNKID